MDKASRKLINAQFRAIKDKISGWDKVDVARKLGCHPSTITRYLRGEIAKEPFALELLEALKEVIAERESIIRPRKNVMAKVFRLYNSWFSEVI